MAVVRLLVGDVDRAVKFYVSKLGFALEAQMGDAFAKVSRDDFELWLSGPNSSAARPMPSGALPVPGGWNRIVLRVGNLAQFASQLPELDVQVRGEIVSGPGGKQLLIEDSEGNPIELFESR